MKFLILIITVFTMQAEAATMYFSCLVKEKSGRQKVDVTVKFAVKDLEPFEGKGELIPYPGITEEQEEQGLILVTPQELPNEQYALMTNLNGQGGDLRIENGNIRLWGDGAGYQFTELVLWEDGDENISYTKGYVRDYGPAYGDDDDTFQQFIKCQKSDRKL
jgi:hypothetical protein